MSLHVRIKPGPEEQLQIDGMLARRARLFPPAPLKAPKRPQKSLPVPVSEIGRYSQVAGKRVYFTGNVPVESELRLPITRARKIKLIIGAVCKAYGVTRAEILSHRRSYRITVARQCIMWRISKKLPMTLHEMGNTLGKDHTTVLHGIRKHQERLDASAVYWTAGDDGAVE